MDLAIQLQLHCQSRNLSNELKHRFTVNGKNEWDNSKASFIDFKTKVKNYSFSKGSPKYHHVKNALKMKPRYKNTPNNSLPKFEFSRSAKAESAKFITSTLPDVYFEISPKSKEIKDFLSGSNQIHYKRSKDMLLAQKSYKENFKKSLSKSNQNSKVSNL